MDAEHSGDILWQKSAGFGAGFGEAPREAGLPVAGASHLDYILAYDDLLSEGVGGEEIRQQLLGMSEADEQLAMEILSAYESQGGARSPLPPVTRPTPVAEPRPREDGDRGSPPSPVRQWLLEHEDILSEVAFATTAGSPRSRLSDEALEAALAECSLSGSPTRDLPQGSSPTPDLPQSAGGASPAPSEPPGASGSLREQPVSPRAGGSSPSAQDALQAGGICFEPTCFERQQKLRADLAQ